MIVSMELPMPINATVNGKPSSQISIHDRGLLYGDGVFRTLRVSAGQIICWQRHYQKLKFDCAAIGIICPDFTLLTQELQPLLQQHPNSIAKIIITRGLQAERGYRPLVATFPTRIISISLPPQFPDKYEVEGVKVRVCKTRLAYQTRLAGLKHLNKLENVIAAGEWDDPHIAEGLMLDTFENVIECTRSNIFAIRAGLLYTPDLSKCGVAGIQRDRVIEWAKKNNIPHSIKTFNLSELFIADEVFLVNSVIGLWPVRELIDQSEQTVIWRNFPIGKQVQEWLNCANT